MGLVDGVHLELVEELEEPNRYRAGGWLAAEGFAGQELRFVLFRCALPLLDGAGDPGAAALDLSGRGGEAAEFGRARWTSFDDLAADAWKNKVPTQRACGGAGDLCGGGCGEPARRLRLPQQAMKTTAQPNTRSWDGVCACACACAAGGV